MTTALVLVGAVLAAVVLTGASGGSSGKTFKVAFDNAFGLTKGGDLRVAGVKAGSTNSFKLSKGPECQNPGIKGPPRTCAIVEAEITQPGFKSLRQDGWILVEVADETIKSELYVPGEFPTRWLHVGLAVSIQEMRPLP